MDKLNNSEQFHSLNFQALFQEIWKKKTLIIIITAMFGVVGVFYALSLPNVYRSTAILSPKSDDSPSGLSSLGGVSSLASLAGISLGGKGGANRSQVALQLITSWGFLEKFIEKHNLQAKVYAANNWDKNNNILIYDEDVYDVNAKQWLIKDENNEAVNRAPSSWELYEKFEPTISVSQDDESGFISISVEHYSPFVAKQFVDLLISEINHELQTREINEISSRIKYLNSQIEKTNVAEMRSIFFELIKEQTQSLMLAEVSSEYAMKTISPSKIAEKKAKPSRAILVITITLMGFMVSVLLVLVRFSQRIK